MELTKEIVNNSWVYKYKPQRIDDIILPENIKNILKQWVKVIELSNGKLDFNMPNILLIGTPGIGKTSIINAILNELDITPLKINASLDRGIDTLKTDINEYIRSLDILNITKKNYVKKVVFLDEVDNLSSAFQNAFRSLIEEYYDKVRFICTGNINNLNEALVSRFTEGLIDFNEYYESLSLDDVLILKKDIMNKLKTIVEIEKGNYSDKVLANIVKTYFPDYRKIMNTTYLQFIKNDGDLTFFQEEKKIDTLFDMIQNNTIQELINYVWKMFNIEPMYKRLINYVSDKYVGDILIKLILTIENYHYRHVSSIIDRQTNFLSCCLEIKKILSNNKPN